MVTVSLAHYYFKKSSDHHCGLYCLQQTNDQKLRCSLNFPPATYALGSPERIARMGQNASPIHEALSCRRCRGRDHSSLGNSLSWMGSILGVRQGKNCTAAGQSLDQPEQEKDWKGLRRESRRQIPPPAAAASRRSRQSRLRAVVFSRFFMHVSCGVGQPKHRSSGGPCALRSEENHVASLGKKNYRRIVRDRPTGP